MEHQIKNILANKELFFSYLSQKKSDLTKAELNYYNKIIHNNKSIPEKKSNVVNKILDDCSLIYKALIPLYKLNVHFSLAIAGGLVREMASNKQNEIKDIDLILSLNMPKLRVKDMYDVWGFEALQYNWLAKSSVGLTYKEKTYHIIKFLLEKEHPIINSYSPNKKNKEEVVEKHSEYLVRDLNGVIKIESPELNYPIDILITSNTPEKFISNFDFNICQGLINLVKLENTKQNTFDFPSNDRDLLNRILPNKLFLKDLKNKTISMNLDYRSINDIKRSIEQHLPRIIHKYPEYKVIFELNDKIAINHEDKKTIVNHYHLQKTLTSTTTTSKKVKKI